MNLPIQEVVPDILSAITQQDCILSAPPGAGKSTYLPLQLLALKAFSNQQILLLQPRQVAVRSIANYLASQLNERVGQTVGYQMRGESAVSKSTRLCVITEGLLTAKLQQDPELSNIALIIFDEFHERSVQSDIALGLSLEVQSALREDLRLLVMSATLNIKEISALMPHAKLVQSAGRTFPIQYIYQALKPRERLEDAVFHTITQTIAHHEGNILAFLPGASSINKVAKLLQQIDLPNVLIAPLYGALEGKRQQQAILLPKLGLRKVVLATNIAETSLTIDGVNIVIDSGREKVQRLHIARKSNQLSEQMISKASSVQRAGRAGRQQAGLCYRLWSEQQQQVLPESSAAQITEVDISATLLILLEWGTDFEHLLLLDKPSNAQISYAYELLENLLLVDNKKALTALGKTAATYNTHPRLASLLAHAQHSKFPPVKCLIIATLVAIVEGRSLDKLVQSSDIVKQCQYVLMALPNFTKSGPSSNTHSSIKDIIKDVLRNFTKLLRGQKLLQTAMKELPTLDELDAQIGKTVLLAFPDKIAMRRTNDTYSLADGTGAEFAHFEQESSYKPKWIICIDTQITQSANGIIRRYCELSPTVIDPYLRANTQISQQQSWDNNLAKVVVKQVSRLDKIVISSQPASLITNDDTAILLIEQIRRHGLATLLGKAQNLLGRLHLAKIVDQATEQELPDLSIASLSEELEKWLWPYLSKLSSWQQLQSLNWQQIIQSMLSWHQQQYIDEFFPSYFIAPTGNKHNLDYTEQNKVTLAIRLQELYGLTENPSVGKNRCAITLSLLSPAHREIQKTSDLAGFWQGSYADVQKDMKGRYQKHYWPDDPGNATPTTKIKRKM